MSLLPERGHSCPRQLNQLGFPTTHNPRKMLQQHFQTGMLFRTPDKTCELTETA